MLSKAAIQAIIHWSVQLFLWCLLICSAQAQVVTVPYNPNDLNAPHLAYNGRPTILKAISRAACNNVYFRWDVDDDGVWDLCNDRSLAISNGKWYLGDRYDLGCKCMYPNLPSGTVNKLALVQVACNVNALGQPVGNTYYGIYPVHINADIPSDPNLADDDELAYIREITIDDAMWFLHQNITRSGTQAYLNEGSSAGIETGSSLGLLAFALHDRLPAYETYNNYGVTPPSGFTAANTYRWNTDPYAEDAGALLNYMMNKLVAVTVTSNDEADDGTSPISGTNNGQGLMVNNANNFEINNKSALLAALAHIDMEGTVAQAGGTGVLGKTIEYIAQEMVDYGAYAQAKSATPAADGGWGYTPSPSNLLAQQSGGWYFALREAETEISPFGLHVPNYVKLHIPNMLKNNQSANGAALYDNGVNYEILESTSLSLYGAEWLGWQNWSIGDNTPTGYPGNSLTRGQCRQIYDNYAGYLSNNWTSSSSGNNPFSATLWTDGTYNSSSLPNAFGISILNARLAAGSNYSYFLGHDIFREFSVSLAKNQDFGTSVNYTLKKYGSMRYPASYYMASFMPNRYGLSAMAIITLTVGPTAALPVELINFEASRVDSNTVMLQWQSAQESQMLKYEVQRSTNGMAFRNIGSVSATNTQEIHRYEYLDGTASNTKPYYYRLHMVDLDGSGKYGPISYVAQDISILVWPNPVKDRLYMHFYTGASSDNMRLAVQNSHGVTVFTTDLWPSTDAEAIQIPIEFLAPGIYYLRIWSPMGYQSGIIPFVKAM